MALSTGIPELDQRVGGLRPGGVYLLAGTAGVGKRTALVQFLQAGLDAGERVAFVGGAAARDVIETGRHVGLGLDAHWQSGRLLLIGYQGGFARRIAHAADPDEVLAELGTILDNGVTRVAIDQAGVFWEGHAGTSAGQQFLDWADRRRLTVLATLATGLEENLTAATSWVIEGSAGVFELEQQPDGVRQLWVRRFNPPLDLRGPVTLALIPGKGLVPPLERPNRRQSDMPPVDPRALLFLQLATGVPADLVGWLRARFDVEIVTEPLALVPRLQEKPSFGVILAYVDRANVSRAVLACQAARQMSGAAIIVTSDESLRAADGVRALDAGADDFLAGALNFGELEARISRAATVVRARPRPGEAGRRRSSTPEGSSEELDQPGFTTRVRQRLDTNDTALFSLISVPGAGRNGRPLREAALKQIRWEEGDFVGVVGSGFGIFLQNARAAQAEAFLNRLRRALGPTGTKDNGHGFEILSSPSDAAGIRELIEQ